MLELFPSSARVDDGELTLGGVRASELAAEFGTPLVVYCEETIRAQVRAYREAAPYLLAAGALLFVVPAAAVQPKSSSHPGFHIRTLPSTSIA